MKITRRQLSELSRGTAHEGRKTPRCAISPLLPDGCTGRGSGAAPPSCCPLHPSPKRAVSSGSCQQQSPEHISTFKLSTLLPSPYSQGAQSNTGAPRWVQRRVLALRPPPQHQGVVEVGANCGKLCSTPKGDLGPSSQQFGSHHRPAFLFPASVPCMHGYQQM